MKIKRIQIAEENLFDLVCGNSHLELGGFDTDDPFTYSIDLDKFRDKIKIQHYEDSESTQIYNLHQFVYYVYEPVELFKPCGIPLKSLKVMRYHIRKDWGLQEKDDNYTIESSWVEEILLDCNYEKAYIICNEHAFSKFEYAIQVINLKNGEYFIYEEC